MRYEIVLNEMKKESEVSDSFLRATDGIRTRDPNLGKVVLYQLSHCRIYMLCSLEQKIIYNRIDSLSIDFLKKFK